MKTTYKVIVAGQGNVGKTTWVQKLRTKSFETKYVATLGVEASSFQIQTDRDIEFTINMWDTAGLPKCGGGRALNGYYRKADGAIVMADSTNPRSAEVTNELTQQIRAVAGNIPIVIVASKSDLGAPEFPNHYQISTKVDEEDQLWLPLHNLIHQMTGDYTIQFH